VLQPAGAKIRGSQAPVGDYSPTCTFTFAFTFAFTIPYSYPSSGPAYALSPQPISSILRHPLLLARGLAGAIERARQTACHHPHGGANYDSGFMTLRQTATFLGRNPCSRISGDRLRSRPRGRRCAAAANSTAHRIASPVLTLEAARKLVQAAPRVRPPPRRTAPSPSNMY
jgi:hypothetical protein